MAFDSGNFHLLLGGYYFEQSDNTRDTRVVPSDALARAQAEFGAWVAVTDGANGVRIADAASFSHVPAFRVDVVDTLGAGDIWHGAFALRLAEGADELEAVRFANAAAALKCLAFGGASTCPDRVATEIFLRENA